MLKLEKTGKWCGAAWRAGVLWGLMLALPAAAAWGFDVHVSVDVNRITLEESIQLTIEIEGAKADPDISPIIDFKVIPRGTSTSMNFINGKLDRKTIFKYLLIPLKTGPLSIPPIQVTKNGESVFSKQIEVQVTEKRRSAEQDAQEKAPMFATSEISESSIFVGQQAVYTLKFYTSKRLGGLGFEMPPRFDGFNATPLEKEKTYLATIDGAQYQVTQVDYIISRRTPGDFRIEPAVLSAKVRIQTRSNSALDPFFDDPFFSTGSYKPVRVSTNPVEVNVLALPPYKGNDSFSGLVGQFDISMELDQPQIKSGESVTLSIRLSGNGNIMDAGEPAIKIDAAAFKTYNDNPVESIRATTGGFQGYKLFKKALVPAGVGQFPIGPASVVVFDVKKKQYRTLETQMILLDVLPSGKLIDAQNHPFDMVPSSQEKIVKKIVRFQNKDIFDIKEGLEVLIDQPALPPKVFLSLLAIPFAVFLSVWGFCGIRKRPVPISRQMADKARYHLRIASKKDPAEDAFLSHLYSALVSIVMSCAGKKGETVTRDEIRRIMDSRSTDPDDVEDLIRIFDTLESIRFGGARTDENRVALLLESVRRMSKKFCAAILLACFLFPFQKEACAQPAAEVFTQGVSLYRSGNYASAADRFKILAETGIENPYLYYNIGNAYLKAGQIGAAVLWYERAKLMSPRDPDLAFNLKYARERITDKQENAIDIREIFFFWKGVFSLKTIQLGTVLWFFLFGSWAVWRMLHSNRIFNAVGLIMAGFCLLFCLICFEQYSAGIVFPRAVIVVPKASVRSGNSESATRLFELHEGTLVKVKDKKNGYLKIVFSEEKTGWVNQSEAEQI